MRTGLPIRLCVDPAGGAAAPALAAELGLPLAAPGPEEDLVLAFEPAGLVLREGPARRGCLGGPLRVDLLRGPLAWRLRHGGGPGQAVARAVGLGRSRPAPRVVDATAGLGRDAVLLAWLGCQVVALERSPVVHALLRDGLRRAAADPELAARVVARLELHLAEAREWLLGPGRAAAPEVVYLDPMHPPRGGHARTRKEMRYLRLLVGEDPDSGALLAAARAAARDRVVVKRPRLAPPLGPGVRREIRGRSTRFDVHFPGKGREDALGQVPDLH